MAISSEINEIRKKMISSGWPKQVKSMTIKGIHGFSDKQISFQFPVCAIVGENGTGKSTILKLLACAYKNDKNFYPSKFFPDTKWEQFKEPVGVSYQIAQGQDVITRNMGKVTKRWRGYAERPTNKVFYFDINRIQAIESLIGYSKLAKTSIREIASRNLLPESIESIREIMGRNYLMGRYAKTSADTHKEIGVLKLHSGEMSKFHQGAGESIILDIVSALENVPNSSLIIIDEIESSLHPRAQRRLIRQLLYLARVKTLQIVISTHSPYVLNELPSDARILLTRINGGIEVFYGPSTELCLTQIDEDLHYELYVLVEDVRAASVVREILRNSMPDILKRVGIISVGTADIVKKFEEFASSGKCPFPIIGLVDADQKDMKDITKLPGEFAPEKQIIQDIIKGKHYNQICSLLGGVDMKMIKKEIEDVQTTSDFGKWIEKIAQRLVVSQETLWDCLTTVWVKNCLTSAQQEGISKPINERLQTYSATA